jgi:hypothetical protein
LENFSTEQNREKFTLYSANTVVIRGGVCMTNKPSEEFEKFDKAMDKIMSVSKEELDRRIAEAKKNKTGARYPKEKKKA